MATYNPTHLNMQKTDTNGVKPLFEPVVNRHVLERAKEELFFSQLGQKIKVPKGQGKTIAFDRMEPLAVKTEALVEGVTPEGDNLSITRITTVPTQHGRYITTTDEFDFYAHDPSPKVLNISELFADNEAETFDVLTRAELDKGTNVQYAGGESSAASVTAKFTVDEIRKAARTLKKNKAKKFDGSYVCVIDADLQYDLMSEVGKDGTWIDVSKYANPKNILAGEIGTLYGVRFVVTTQDLKQSSSDLHCAYFFGQNAFGTTAPEGNVETIWKNKGSGGTSDPLNQRSTAGWKGHHCAKILTEGWLVRCLCAVTA